MTKKQFFLLFLGILPLACLHAQTISLLKTFDVAGAKQAVAVDRQYFYVINNDAVSKYRKETGKLTAEWHDGQHILKHMNSGVVLNNKLYCAHSNYPDCPMASSIEVFDTRTLQPVETHSFGIQFGSATWIDYYQGSWWVCFAHYTGKGSCEGKDNSWTQLIQFDTAWHPVAGWIFPGELIARFNGRSNSGGAWGDDGKLYVTGHDAKELYVLSLPERASTLKMERILPMEAEGQGIAFDRSIKDKTIIYGIKRAADQVVIMELAR